MKYRLAASLMGMNILRVEEQLKVLNTRAYTNHVDIIDWHFAKNMCFSPMFVEQISKISTIPLDVHVMVKDMELDFIETIIKSGANIVSLHPEEIGKNVFKYIDYIKSNNCQFGVVLNPATPLDSVKLYIGHVDLLTFMGVTPGFPGQPLVPVVLDKIEEAIRTRNEKGYKYLTQMDGGCHENTIKMIYKTGIDIMIVGKTLLFSKDEDLITAWDMCIETIDACLRA
jgi:D-allulose-6-phosphate 3-epimerase